MKYSNIYSKYFVKDFYPCLTVTNLERFFVGDNQNGRYAQRGSNQFSYSYVVGTWYEGHGAHTLVTSCRLAEFGLFVL